MWDDELNVELDGVIYTLRIEHVEGRAGPFRLEWLRSDFTEPPTAIQSELWKKLLTDQMDVFLKAIGPNGLLHAATCLNNFGVADFALELIEMYLAESPEDPAALAVLCSALRRLGRPQEALERTSLRRHQCHPLATSRAAAWCDLGHEIEARKEANRAKAILRGGSTGELIRVYQRTFLIPDTCDPK